MKMPNGVPLDPDTRERMLFFEASINHAIETFGDPILTRHLGANAVNFFLESLHSSRYAEIVEGEIQMPEEGKTDDAILPVVVIRPDEQLTLTEDYGRQTDTQKRQTLKQFSAWKPVNGISTADAYSRLMGSALTFESPVITATERSSAMTGAVTDIHSVEEAIQPLFTNAPKKGLGLIAMRPHLSLKLEEGERAAPADTLAHELTHLWQALRKPVDVVHSQRSVDMLFLRKELEAYHLGAVVYRHMEGMPGKRKGPVRDGIVQDAVDLLRTLHGIDPLDPYRPSPALMRRLEEAGVGSIMHATIDYDELLSLYEASRPHRYEVASSINPESL